MAALRITGRVADLPHRPRRPQDPRLPPIWSLPPPSLPPSLCFSSLAWPGGIRPPLLSARSPPTSAPPCAGRMGGEEGRGEVRGF
eukprot:3543779-Rhodomonas_salina.1